MGHLLAYYASCHYHDPTLHANEYSTEGLDNLTGLMFITMIASMTTCYISHNYVTIERCMLVLLS